MSIDFNKLKTAAEHAGNGFESLLHTLIHVVEALAPAAEIAGVVTGNPEITMAAKLAETGAQAADNAMQGKTIDAPTVVSLTNQVKEVFAHTPKQAG